MPIFVLGCVGPNACPDTIKRLLGSVLDIGILPPCSVCGCRIVRKPTGPTTQVKETLDNGAMPRSVERLANAERLYKERADSADSNAGKSRK